MWCKCTPTRSNSLREGTVTKTKKARNTWEWGQFGFMVCNSCRKPSYGIWRLYLQGQRVF